MYTLDKTEGHTSTVSGVYVVSVVMTMTMIVYLNRPVEWMGARGSMVYTRIRLLLVGHALSH